MGPDEYRVMLVMAISQVPGGNPRFGRGTSAIKAEA